MFRGEWQDKMWRCCTAHKESSVICKPLLHFVLYRWYECVLQWFWFVPHCYVSLYRVTRGSVTLSLSSTYMWRRFSSILAGGSSDSLLQWFYRHSIDTYRFENSTSFRTINLFRVALFGRIKLVWVLVMVWWYEDWNENYGWITYSWFEELKFWI